jgi:hypothetical protein
VFLLLTRTTTEKFRAMMDSAKAWLITSFINGNKEKKIQFSSKMCCIRTSIEGKKNKIIRTPLE